MTIRRTALFIGFFFEALKPHAINILQAGCSIADSLVSASTRVDIQTSEHGGTSNQNKSQLD
jgi:hypothetical protein